MDRAVVSVHKLADTEVKRLQLELDFVKKEVAVNNFSGEEQNSPGQVPETIYIKCEEPDADPGSFTIKEEPIDCHQEPQADQSGSSFSPAQKRELGVATAGAGSWKQEPGSSFKEEIPFTSNSRSNSAAEGGVVSPNVKGEENFIDERLGASQQRVVRQLRGQLCNYFHSNITLKQLLCSKDRVSNPYRCESSSLSKEQNDDMRVRLAAGRRNFVLFRCDLCDYSNARSSKMKLHKAAKHRIGELFKCDLCDYSNAQISNLKVHKAAKHSAGELFKCDLCDYSSPQSSNLKLHKAAKHSIGELFKCDSCHYLSPVSSNLKVHKAAKHGIGELFKCDLCDYSSPLSSNLKKHKAAKHSIGEMFKCDLCDYSNAQSGNLKKHKAAKHSIGELFKCDLCDYSSPYNSKLQNHKSMKHGIAKIVKRNRQV